MLAPIYNKLLEIAKRNATATLQNAAAAIDNGTTLDVAGMNSVVFQVTGTFVGTIWFRGSVDGTNYEDLPVYNVDGVSAAKTTKAGIYKADITGYKNILARVDSITSGTITVFARTSTNPLPEILKKRNVELAKSLGASVAASGSSAVFSNIDVSQFPLQYIAIRGNAAHNFRVDVQYISSSTSLGDTLGNQTVIESQTTGQRFSSDWIESKGGKVTVAIYNLDSASAHTYDIYLYGVR